MLSIASPPYIERRVMTLPTGTAMDEATVRELCSLIRDIQADAAGVRVRMAQGERAAIREGDELEVRYEPASKAAANLATDPEKKRALAVVAEKLEKLPRRLRELKKREKQEKCPERKRELRAQRKQMGQWARLHRSTATVAVLRTRHAPPLPELTKRAKKGEGDGEWVARLSVQESGVAFCRKTDFVVGNFH